MCLFSEGHVLLSSKRTRPHHAHRAASEMCNRPGPPGHDPWTLLAAQRPRLACLVAGGASGCRRPGGTVAGRLPVHRRAGVRSSLTPSMASRRHAPRAEQVGLNRGSTSGASPAVVRCESRAPPSASQNAGSHKGQPALLPSHAAHMHHGQAAGAIQVPPLSSWMLFRLGHCLKNSQLPIRASAFVMSTVTAGFGRLSRPAIIGAGSSARFHLTG